MKCPAQSVWMRCHGFVVLGHEWSSASTEFFAVSGHAPHFTGFVQIFKSKEPYRTIASILKKVNSSATDEEEILFRIDVAILERR